MANDWLPMRVNLGTDPAVTAMSRHLKLDRFAVVGRLHAIWAWAGEHTADGRLPLTVLEDLDDVVGRRGFAAELMRVGWLSELPDGGLMLPLWDRWNGASAKGRITATEKKRAQRARKQGHIEDTSGTESGHIGDTSGTNSGHIGDQRREEKSNTPIVPLSGDNQPEELGEELVLDSTPVDEVPSTDGDLAWVKSLVRMRASTALDASGERAWKKARAIVAATPEEDRVVLTAFYGADRSAKEYWRQEAATLLNHWQGEISKAHDWARRSGFSASAEKSEKKETWGGSFEDLQVVYAAWWRRDYGEEEMPPCVPFDRMDSWMQREVLAFVAGIVEQKPGDGQGADEGRAA
jgi:hypothetical protein